MKQIASNYAYSPATNVVTLTGVNIDADQLLLIVAPGVGRTLYNFASVTGTVVAGTDTRVTLNASTAGLTTTSPLVIFYDDQASAQAVTGTVALDPASLVALENITVTVGSSVALAAGSAQIGSVTVANFPSTQTIAGTVTVGAIIGPAGGSCLKAISPSGDAVRSLLFTKDSQSTYGELSGSAPGTFNLPVYGTVTVGNSVTIGSLPAISGTVTANVADLISQGTDGDGGPYRKGVQLIGLNWDNDGSRPVQTDNVGQLKVVAGSDSQNFPISGTVTANNPNGALTTRFGSVVTANTAQITSAVTNTSRKYLLAQNISAGTVTIGIGFSPTTTQGIQLTAGGGLTFDAFCPTGAVYWLGAVTGANYCLIEG